MVHSEVSRAAGIGLDINMSNSGAEEFFRSFLTKSFYTVNIFVPRVISFPRIALGVFVFQNTPHRFPDGFTDIIFRGD